MILYCTKKFLTELRLKTLEVSARPESLHPLDEWHAHLFFLYPRRKCAIFMHAGTKFCFVAFDRNREQLNDIRGIFRKGLGRALFDEHYPEPVIRLFYSRLEDIQIGPGRDRRIQGFINQRVLDLQFIADDDPQDRRVSDESIAGLHLRRIPMVTQKASFAIEQMREALITCAELRGVDINPAEYKHEELERFYDFLHLQGDYGLT